MEAQFGAAMDAVLNEMDSGAPHAAGTNDIYDFEDNLNNNRSANSENEPTDSGPEADFTFQIAICSCKSNLSTLYFPVISSLI